MNPVVLILCAILSFSSDSVGRIDAIFYDFETYYEMDASSLMSRYDIQAKNINSENIEDFVFNIGVPVNEKCNENAIACIKFKNNET